MRDAYRKTILPALVEFDPDMIFVSAGFDAHRADVVNFGYGGMIEEDYEWLTEQLVKVANRCCNGRIVSALEGGYKIHGGIVSPFARSVAGHVRALAEGGRSREQYDAEEAAWEGRFERHRVEEKEKKRQLKAERMARPPPDGAGAVVHPTMGGEAPLAELPHEGVGGEGEGGEEPSRKRNRKEVDYQQLFEQMQQEGGAN